VDRFGEELNHPAIRRGSWSAKFGYLYMDRGTANGAGDFVLNPTFQLGPIVERVIGTTTFRDHIFRSGLNHKFDGSHPVIASY
jgi:hypothetical protein